MSPSADLRMPSRLAATASPSHCVLLPLQARRGQRARHPDPRIAPTSAASSASAAPQGMPTRFGNGPMVRAARDAARTYACFAETPPVPRPGWGHFVAENGETGGHALCQAPPIFAQKFTVAGWNLVPNNR